MQLPFGLQTPPSQKRTPRKRTKILCDMVKPASALQPEIEGLDFETPVHVGPFMLKPPCHPLRRSPRKTSVEPVWIEGPAILWDHAQRKKAKKENPGKYREMQRFIASHQGTPPLSSPSQSSVDES